MTVVGVYPSAEWRARRRLFTALAHAFPLSFEPVDTPDGTSLDALVLVDRDDGELTEVRRKSFLAGLAPGRPERCSVRFSGSPLLDARLRKRSLNEAVAHCGPLHANEGDHVLASVEGRPVWLKRATAAGFADVVANAPAELSNREPLKDRLDPGRFLELLPLVHFLREVCASAAWQAPPARAAFVVDDPNLHWPTYGYLRYRDVARHARACSYHISMAMVPADVWCAHPGAVRLFRDNADVLSLCIHGNDHRWHELGRPATKEAARQVVAHATRRIAAFRRRTRLAVSPVMVPPHESCSAESMSVMLELGIAAATVTRPYPWMPFAGAESPYSTPVPGHSLSGWEVAELMPDGFPVMVRREFDAHDDAVLRSYLGQPIIQYGHMTDFAEGLAVLESAAAVVNSLPSASWASLADIASGNFEWRRDGATLEVRPYARSVRVRADPDVNEIRLRSPRRVDGFQYGVTVSPDPDGHGPAFVEGDTVVLTPGRERATTLTIRWRPRHEIAPDSLAPPAFSGRAIARRLLSEGRDRVTPLVRRRPREAGGGCSTRVSAGGNQPPPARGVTPYSSKLRP